MEDIVKSNEKWINDTWEKIYIKLKRTSVSSRDKLPYTTINGIFDNCAERCITGWTNGFWGGLMWLMYSETKDEDFKKTALRSEEILDAGLEEFKELFHDVGFMWHLVCGANYRLTGDKKAYNKNLYAAASLFSRYNIDGEYIRAWNNEGAEGWSIIDCLMNLPILYWASIETGDKRFARVAIHHADMAIRDHIRPDGSVNHIVEHDTEQVGVICNHAGQGYSESSCWTRGLAWAIYGMILSYKYTLKKDYLDAAKKCANYFSLNCASTDYLTVVDFMAPTEPVYYDSTAGVCAACGMLEIAKYVSEAEARAYTKTAINILKATEEHFCNWNENEDSIVQMGTERYPVIDNYMTGVHKPIIYGDFFFVEGILKLKGNDFSIW